MSCPPGHFFGTWGKSTSPLTAGSSGILILKGHCFPAGGMPCADRAMLSICGETPPDTRADATPGAGKTTAVIATHKTTPITVNTTPNKRLPFPAFTFRMFLPPVLVQIYSFYNFSLPLLAHK
jgi:hypothetical protein